MNIPVMRLRIVAFLLIGIFLSSCGSSDKKNEVSGPQKYQQYYVQGKFLYKQHCSNCHQEDGSGLGELIPPLNNADYLINNPDRSVCLIKNGIKGSIVVNGVEYNQPMIGHERLSPLEIAEIMTYILNSWDNKLGLYPVKRAEKVLRSCQN
jgi:mono/diheme cytochrome c family protein